MGRRILYVFAVSIGGFLAVTARAEYHVIRLSGPSLSSAHRIASGDSTADLFCAPHLIERVCDADTVRKFASGVRNGKRALYDRFSKEERTLANPAYRNELLRELQAGMSGEDLKQSVIGAVGDLRRALLTDPSLPISQRLFLVGKLSVRAIRFLPAAHDPWYSSYCGPHAMGGDEGSAAAYFMSETKEVVFCPDTLLNAIATARELGGNYREALREVLFDTVAHEVGHSLNLNANADLAGVYRNLAACWFQNHAREVQLPLSFLTGNSVARGIIGFGEFLSSTRFNELTADQYLAIAISQRIASSGLDKRAAFRKMQRLVGMSCRQRDEAPKTHASKEFLIDELLGKSPRLRQFFGCAESPRVASEPEPTACTFAGAERLPAGRSIASSFGSAATGLRGLFVGAPSVSRGVASRPSALSPSPWIDRSP